MSDEKGYPMTTLQKRKMEQLIDRRQYDEARKFLDGLVKQGDKEAQALRADMDITYPVTKVQKAAKGVNRVVFAIALGVLALFALVAILTAINLY
jgi:predicted Zn-dependent protease